VNVCCGGEIGKEMLELIKSVDSLCCHKADEWHINCPDELQSD